MAEENQVRPVEVTSPDDPRFDEDLIKKYPRANRKIQVDVAPYGLQAENPNDQKAAPFMLLASEHQLPRRFLVGADAVSAAEQTIVVLKQQIDAYRELSSSLAIDK